MKLELSRNGCVVDLSKIELGLNIDSIEPGKAFIAYPISDPKNEIEKNIAKNFDDLINAIRVYACDFLYAGDLIRFDRAWIASQLAEKAITIQKIDSRPQLFCSECQNMLSLEDDLREDGVRRIFAKPCEKCIEHAKEEAVEEYNENYERDTAIRVSEFLM